MKKIIYLAAFCMATVQAAAQETYENAKIATEDLNGTARYIGMGGAMDALGADISTIGTNPAGIGLFRKSSASLSAGLVSQQGASSFGGGHTNNISFDQVGFVWANQISGTDFVNFAFNYHKSRNFNYILSVADGLESGRSLSRIAYEKQYDDMLFPWTANGTPRTNANPSYECNQLDEVIMSQTDLVWDGNTMGYYDASSYAQNRATKGYVAEYDFNLSGNVQNQFYWGITFGVHDVNYSHYGEYTEMLLMPGGGTMPLKVQDDRRIDGSGFDIKLGAIFRPIDESPLRFGVSVATPTWYKLTTKNNTLLRGNQGNWAACENFDYTFKLYTPWKFGLSVGHTIGNYLALGLGYEYADYSALDSRYDTSDEWEEHSESDDEMNRHTDRTLKGVSTIKLGAEVKPTPELAVRLGYNYVSPMYEKHGYKDGTVYSMGTSVSTATDFTNWEETHRITCGLGYQLDKWNLALAYQYQVQSGMFEPFYYESPYDDTVVVDANRVKVDNKRHQLLLTIGYTF